MKIFAFALAIIFIIQLTLSPVNCGGKGNKIIIQRPKHHHCCCEHEKHGGEFDWGFGGFGDFGGGLGGGFGGFGGGFRRRR